MSCLDGKLLVWYRYIAHEHNERPSRIWLMHTRGTSMRCEVRGGARSKVEAGEGFKRQQRSRPFSN